MIPLAPALAAQIDELDRLGQSRPDAWQVPRAEGELLAALAIAHRAKLIVEVGTSYGFSGLWWAAALAVTGGHLHTIDASAKKYTSAKATFAAAGVAERVTSHFGDARQLSANMPDAIDLVFIDADKPSTRAYFDLLWPKVRAGGGVLTDNVLTHPDDLAGFVGYVRTRADAHSVQLPVGGGLEWTVKVP
ncbi:MAG: class I SAM-dependent methyltransferase [Verrucomicrobia bacterium]|nr:class I SAM-dependent methyltransferase [Verrucomicrobiota bacterium]